MTEHSWKSAHDVCQEALRITQEDRNQSNGDAEDNFSYIALCWTTLLTAGGYLHEGGKALTAADVARMMIALKLCRDSNAPHRDNRVDTIGYALCLERVEPTTHRVEMTPITPHVENPEDEYSVTVLVGSWCDTCKYIKNGPTCRGCYRTAGKTVPSHWAFRRTH